MLKIFRYFIMFFLVISEFGLYARDVQIENVEFNYVGKKIVVNYNILNYKPTERFHLILYFVSESNDTFKSVSITGDFENIEGGYGKTITWDFSGDFAKINNVNMKAVVQVRSVSNQPGPPSNALLSLAVPGLGDRYVRNPRKTIVKPFIITAAAYGFIGAGIYNLMIKNIEEDNSSKAVIPANSKNFQDRADQAALYSYIYLGVGAAIWCGDIIYVLAKSEKNNTNKPRLTLVPVVNPSSNGYLALSAKITF
jgi:hypothetical protein